MNHSKLKAKSRRFAIQHANIATSTSGLTFLLIAASILNGCADIEQNTESHRSEPDAWEKRLERIQRGEEQAEVTTTNENPEDLDERYRTSQRDLEERFQTCFQGVFRNKTFDAGVPWKSEGQGTRRIIAVTAENEVQHWNINKSVRQCEKYFSEPFKGVEEKKLVVRVRKLPYTYKFEEGGNLLCKYQEDDMWQGRRDEALQYQIAVICTRINSAKVGYRPKDEIYHFWINAKCLRFTKRR